MTHGTIKPSASAHSSSSACGDPASGGFESLADDRRRARKERARNARFPRGRRANESSAGAEGARPLPARQDVRFEWAAGRGVDAWRSELTEWAREHTSLKRAITVGNLLLDYLIAHPSVAREPHAFCLRDYVNPIPLSSYLARRGYAGPEVNNTAAAWFDWYLQHRLTASDDRGRLVVSPDHWNPLVRLEKPPSPSETYREALPSRLLREAFTILTEKDWEWAKRQGDWVDVVDGDTGERVRVWCPVRATALALKLLLPLRSFQVRMLESSEGDSECYRDGRWIPNDSPHAAHPHRGVQRGFLRAFRDAHTGDVSTGFYVNTNKSADRFPDAAEEGYSIPWQHDEAIRIVAQLEAWQRRYNPISEPLAWSRIREQSVSLATVPRAGAALFLMRDPCGTDPNHPVTAGRLSGLWDKAVVSLEDRLYTQGQRLLDGSRIRLTFELPPRTDGYVQRKSRYDLHTLRVTLITLLATEGGVPLHILSKCIAGHSALLMTLYYVKVNAETMKRTMVEAASKIDTGAQAEFARYLRSETRKAEGFVANDPAGVAALDRSAPASWMVVDTGICPVGGQPCDRGGPKLLKGGYGPVPGGPRNCTRCRFHITGPAFLGGLVARFNASSVNVQVAKKNRERAELDLTAANDALFDAQTAREEGDPQAVRRAQERLDVADASLANHAGTLHAVYGLVERCKAIGAGQGGLNLVLAGDLGDLQTAVWSTSDLDVMDAVCQAATVHPCDETRAASLRRSQLLDRLLVRSGQLPVLLELSEEEALIRGNELMRLLDVQFGRERALALLDGKESQLEARVAAGVIAALSGNGDAADRDGRPALAPPVREAISLEPSTESDE